MIKRCCICHDKADCILVHGEWVCPRCHEEATGEKPNDIDPDKYRRESRRNRIREALIEDRMRNKWREAFIK